MTSRARADKMIRTGFRWSKFVPEERLQKRYFIVGRDISMLGRESIIEQF